MNRVAALAAFALIVFAAQNAQAQSIRMGTFRGFLTGHAGIADGGDLSDPRMTLGASVSVQEQDGWGAELDFGRSDDAQASGQVLDLTTYMVNGSWVKPTGHVRPFGVIGGGVMQIHGCGPTCNTSQTTYDLGFSLGAGVIALVHDAFGVRGDARYLFTSADHPDLGRPENFGFWRLSLGATFSWAIVP